MLAQQESPGSVEYKASKEPPAQQVHEGLREKRASREHQTERCAGNKRSTIPKAARDVPAGFRSSALSERLNAKASRASHPGRLLWPEFRGGL
jgi:hypothetical protein